MKITVTRSGGFAGITRRAHVDVADQPDAADWDTLLRRIRLADLPPPPANAPDRFVYTIEIDGTSAQVGEADMTGPLRELVTRVLSADHS